MTKYISCSKCNDNGKTSNACHCDEEPQVFSRCEPAYEKLQSDLRKLVEELHTEADDPNLHLLVAYAFKDVADRIEKLIEGG